MAGIELKSQLEKEIAHYLGVPYARNVWVNGILKHEAVFAGKGTYQEIEYATACAAEREKVDIDTLSPEEIFKLRHRHRIGIDCSGLAYHLLNKLDQLRGGAGILYKVTGIDRSFGIVGIRAISAANLTHEHNAHPVKHYSDVQIGDLIRHHNGTHVILILDLEGNRIHYVHSSKNTLTEGAHYGHIDIVKPELPLSFQEWSDTLVDGTKFQSLSNLENLDGIYRLKCWL